VAADNVTVCAHVYVPGAGENAGAAAAGGVLVPVVGAVVATWELLAPQPVKSKGSMRQGAIQKRFVCVVKIESFKWLKRKDFMSAPLIIRPSARVHITDI
jgi:hypothetical protein